MLLLALPVLTWLLWPVRRPAWVWVRGGVTFATVTVFLLDAALRHYLHDHYQAAADSALVMSAAANTNSRETWEYLASQWPSLAVVGAALAVALALAGLLSARAGRREGELGRGARWVLILLLILGSVGYVSKPWRRLHPVLFWPTWSLKVEALRQGWADQQAQREQLMANARRAQPTMAWSGSSTVVLVLSESLNRDNMSLYGYSRPTTPGLVSMRHELGHQLLQVRDAWSVQSATVPSLSGIFSFGERDETRPVGQTQHLLALSRAAGYKVWWISNHDDVAIEQQHARLGDHVWMVNRAPGRSSAMLDGGLLDEFETALKAPESRKLIVLHLLGAHPHYQLRFPAGEHPFDEAQDEVDRGMVAAGRPFWLRELRRDYDAAVRYHDGVVVDTLRRTRAAVGPADNAAWMLMSDHGQEVGHTVNQAGHSPGTAAGYRIPLLVWRQGGPDPQDTRAAKGFDPALARRPFRADWAAWTLADLLQLRWQGRQPTRNLLDPAYRWEAPTIPVPGWRAEG
ncbi:phosphoethanolamine transferase [Roseateles amylovorans]|uniref:Phosphoethanolamine transferase n=1 Tax=Roseateles amylovorans TaxID=2978473 RepID=A0ABY6ATI2_9BURK|nr:phosphoethanolamine transferase [Roseateles amylovorans]UXH76238.1 phosphoethanolamine transferase [Roseateles amylovorans]